MDVTTRALMLKATDYGENDKFILLYSLEYGKISVHAKGIRKSGAKLKFAADQFCFGQYELAQNGDRFTLKTCQQIESFYALRQDITVYYAACVIAECLVNYTEEEQQESQLFIQTLKALQALTDGCEPLLVVLRYLLGFTKTEGFGLQFGNCVVCDRPTDKVYLDLQRGGLVCKECRTAESTALGAQVVGACTLVENMPYSRLKNINLTLEILKDALTMMYRYIAHSFSPLKSLIELLKLS